MPQFKKHKPTTATQLATHHVATALVAEMIRVPQEPGWDIIILRNIFLSLARFEEVFPFLAS